MKKKMFGVVLLMLFIGMLASQGFAITVPPDDPNDTRIQFVGGAWKLQEDLYEPIEIVESNLTLDGNEHTVTGPGNGTGITITDKTNVVVTDLTVTDFTIGIYASNSNTPEYLGQHHLVGNTVNDNSLYGISLMRSKGNTIEGNDVSFNDSEGIRLNAYCSENVIIDNTLDSNVVRGILLNNSCHYNVLSRNIITNNGSGIYLYQSTGNEIYNNDFINNGTHVWGQYSYNNILSMDPPIGGNYWDDWSGNDNDGDGLIDDNPRTLSVGTDYYPMVAAYSDRMVMLINDAIDFFDEGVATNGIRARGKNPEIPLGQFRDMLEDALGDIMLEDYASACGNLEDALDACDGEKKDLITGPDVETLYDMIVVLTVALGC